MFTDDVMLVGESQKEVNKIFEAWRVALKGRIKN